MLKWPNSACREYTRLFFCISSGRSMGRKGWTMMEVPNGWYEVLRGPRPPSARWPARGQSPQSTRSLAQGKRVPNNDAVHTPPPVRVARSRNRSSPCQSCVARSRDQCFGQRRRPRCQKSHPSCPVAERLEACTEFIAPGSASRNPIRNCRRSKQSAPGCGRVGRRASTIGSGAPGPLNHQRPWMLGAELKRMPAVIDNLLRERSQWKSSRPGSTGVVEGTMIPMDVGTLVDARTEAMIDEARSKCLRVEGASSSVCREVGLL